MKAKILVVEDEQQLRMLLAEAMTMEGHTPVTAASISEAIKHLKKDKFDILLTDVNLPDGSGLDLLPVCSQANPATYMLVMTAYGTVDTAVQAMKSGAADFLTKPISLNDLSNAVRLAIEKLSKPQPVSSASAKQSPIVGNSPVMINLLKQVETVAPFKASVLVTGETGTGKELIARALHQHSPRSKGALVALNCAAIPEQLLEDELFGHVKGAFTGAQTDRKGRIEQADGGTLFLDEIGDMNLALQSKLLRVLQESEFEKLGSSRTVKVDVRVVAATSADLDRKIADGSFRPDLYHRLNVVRLRIPPLRERLEDVVPIAEYLLDQFCQSAGLPDKTLDDAAKQALVSYDFPGNVRQLQNAVERAAIFSGMSPAVQLEHLPEEIKSAVSFVESPASISNGFKIPAAIPDEGLDFSGVVSQLERELLLQTLDKTGGNKMRAAKLLNMKRTTLVEKLKRLQIETENEDSEELINKE